MSWMDEFLPHPTNRFCPKPFPCLQSHSPAIETLSNPHPNPDCTISAEKNHTSVPGLGDPLPRDPAKCLEKTCAVRLCFQNIHSQSLWEGFSTALLKAKQTREFSLPLKTSVMDQPSFRL